MVILGVIGGVILLCILAALWAAGSMNSRQFNFRGRNNSADHHEPKARATGLN